MASEHPNHVRSAPGSPVLGHHAAHAHAHAGAPGAAAGELIADAPFGPPSAPASPTKSPQSPQSAGSGEQDYGGADAAQTEVLDDEPRSILMGIIAQLSKGADLHRVSLPTFVLEPRSFLEKITDFMCHPELILETHAKPDPIDRFIDVVRYFISGWHIRPKGVKKPYNPVLGEHFRCKYNYANGTTGYYCAEQTSHHPPVSNYVFAAPHAHLLVQGEVRPKSKYLGNSAATVMAGETTIAFTNREGEVYHLNLPNIYARGILYGTMLMELGDLVTIKCPKTDLVCDLEFKVKGYFTGSYNALGGKIRRISKPRDVLFEISGAWSDVSYIKPAKGDQRVLFDVHNERIFPKSVAPEAEQEPYESRRVWSKVTQAMLARDLDAATEEKNKIEGLQRAKRIEREERGDEWSPRFFQPREGAELGTNGEVEAFEFRLLRNLAAEPKARAEQLDEFIFTKPPPHPYGDESAS